MYTEQYLIPYTLFSMFVFIIVVDACVCVCVCIYASVHVCAFFSCTLSKIGFECVLCVFLAEMRESKRMKVRSNEYTN